MSDTRKQAEATARYLLSVADETTLGTFEEELVECIRALLAEQDGAGEVACAWCGAALTQDPEAPHRWRCTHAAQGKCFARGEWYLLRDDLSDACSRPAPSPASDEVREALAEIVEWAASEGPCSCNVDSPVECWLCRWHGRATAALAARPAAPAGDEVREALLHCESIFLRYEVNRPDTEQITDGALALIRKALSAISSGSTRRETSGCVCSDKARGYCPVHDTFLPTLAPPPAPEAVAARGSDETPSGLTGRRTKWDSSPTATPTDTAPALVADGSTDLFGRSSGTTTEPLESSTMRSSCSNADTRSSRGADSVRAAESATGRQAGDTRPLAPPPAPSDAAVREAAEAVSQTYYEIAAEVLGEDKVKAEFARRFEDRLAKRRDAALAARPAVAESDEVREAAEALRELIDYAIQLEVLVYPEDEATFDSPQMKRAKAAFAALAARGERGE